MKPRRAPMKRTRLAPGKPLERKTLMPRTGMPRKPAKPKPNGPVKARSESAHIPKPIRDAVLERDGYSCTRCGRYLVDTIRYGLQHRDPRGIGGSKLLHTMANLVTLCGWTVDKGTCTEAVELLDRPRATAEGWLVPHGVAPEDWRVRHFGRWEQPGDRWLPAAPHPRQLEMLGEAA